MSDVLGKHVEMSALLDSYGRLLTDREREILSSYYLYDLSLSEISEGLGISRSAVSDCLKRAGEKLSSYEESMGLVSKKKDARKRLDEGIDPKKVLEDLIDGI